MATGERDHQHNRAETTYSQRCGTSIQGPVSFGTHLEFPPLKLNANIVETNVRSRLCGRIHEDVSEIDRSGLTPNTTPAIIKTGDANVQMG